jgi:hypothetical protein
MPTTIQPWLRAELIAAPETTPGAQLMIPADGIEFHDDQLVFHHQGDVVYVAPQGQLRSITWFARQPHPETARRKAQWPNHGTRWTDEERTQLHRHLRAGHSWKVISHAHGRSRTGCQQEAVKQGWLDGETLAPTATLLGGEGGEAEVGAQTDGKADGALAGAPSDPTPSLALATAAADSSAGAEIATAPADPPPSPVFVAALAGSPADSPPSTSLATAAANPPPCADLAAASAGPPPTPAAVPPNFAVAGTADAIAYPEPAQAAVALAREASAHTDTELQPDRPQIPHQRTDSADTPDSEKDCPPGPGSRFLSRAQSSLARATLGAYMNPPRAT